MNSENTRWLVDTAFQLEIQHFNSFRRNIRSHLCGLVGQCGQGGEPYSDISRSFSTTWLQYRAIQPNRPIPSMKVGVTLLLRRRKCPIHFISVGEAISRNAKLTGAVATRRISSIAFSKACINHLCFYACQDRREQVLYIEYLVWSTKQLNDT